mmetsp:Transcript_84190/g.271507  ORF Transcript_84190/g.271507 Transcript_84190/m.271507 type:complete len:299 (-) Transcript_84190:594-1490(-)
MTKRSTAIHPSNRHRCEKKRFVPRQAINEESAREKCLASVRQVCCFLCEVVRFSFLCTPIVAMWHRRERGQPQTPNRSSYAAQRHSLLHGVQCIRQDTPELLPSHSGQGRDKRRPRVQPQLRPRPCALRPAKGVPAGVGQRRLDGLGGVLPEPRVLQRLQGTQPARRVHPQQREDEAPGALGEGLEGPGEVHGAEPVLLRDEGVRSAVQHLVGHQRVYKAPERPHVRFLVVAMALQNLRSDVLESAAHLSELHAGLAATRQTEIYQLDGQTIALLEHDVLGFEIPVQNIARVQVGQRL